MKATALLERQHRRVEYLLGELASGRADPARVLNELADDLAAHMEIENLIFYPAVRPQMEGLVLEAYEEHALVELTLDRLLAADPDGDHFGARVTLLRELLEHHIAEEEAQLFPKVEQALDGVELEALGKVMKASFDVAVARGHAAFLTETSTRTAADAAVLATGPAKRPAGAARRDNGHADPRTRTP